MTLCQSDGKSWKYHREAERAVPPLGQGVKTERTVFCGEQPTWKLLQRQEVPLLSWCRGGGISGPEVGMTFSSVGSFWDATSLCWAH